MPTSATLRSPVLGSSTPQAAVVRRLPVLTWVLVIGLLASLLPVPMAEASSATTFEVSPAGAAANGLAPTAPVGPPIAGSARRSGLGASLPSPAGPAKAAAAPRQAAAIVVTTNADNLIPDAQCSLREAIANANNDAATFPECGAGSGADTITFAPTAFGILAVNPALGPLVISSSVTISGPGRTALTIDGAGATSIFSITSSLGTPIVGISGLTIARGHVLNQPNGGGGITNLGGEVTISSTDLITNASEANLALSGVIDHGGGAIFSTSPLTVTGSTFRGNWAWRITDSGRSFGGAIRSFGRLVVSDSLFSFNTAGTRGLSGFPFDPYSNTSWGGAINGDAGSITIDNTGFISNNVKASGFAWGGAIRSLAPLTIRASSRFTDNLALGAPAVGGAIRIDGSDLNVSDTTFISNTANFPGGPTSFFNAWGGAIGAPGNQDSTEVISSHPEGIIGPPPPAGSLTISHSQFLSNTAVTGDSAAGGAIYAGIPLTVTLGSTFVGNTANSSTPDGTDGFDARGGAIFSVSALYVSDASFTRNAVSTASTSSFVAGGAIQQADEVLNTTISNTVFISNSASGQYIAHGGALHNSAASALVTGSLFSGNSTSAPTESFGGAVYQTGGSIGSVLSARASSFASNTAGSGGAIAVFSAFPANVDLVNSTVSGNSSTTAGPDPAGLSRAGGGAMMVEFGGFVRLTNTTVVSNTSIISAGGIQAARGAAAAHNAIVGDNPGPAGNCAGAVTSTGFNLTNPPPAGCFAVPGPGDILAANLGLAPLALNPPGTTPTHRPLPGSPAINNADPVACPPTDQRGVPRPQGPGCDIGSFEVDVVALTLTKTATPNPVYVGQPLTYTLAITNSSPGVLSSLRVTDTLPGNVTFGSVGQSGGAGGSCSQAGGTVNCTFTSLDPGNQATVTIVVTPTAAAAGTITNTATVSAVLPDLSSVSSTVTQTTQVLADADLAIRKTANAATVQAGQPLTYTIVVTSGGPSVANNVTVTDTLPAGVTPGPASSTQGACTPGLGIFTCAIGTLASGGVVTITTVITPLVPGTITNTATVGATEVDLNPSNNSASVPTSVSAAADLAIGKSASPSPATQGQPLVYTLVITNSGPTAATSVRLTDTLPLSVTGVTASADTGGACVVGGTTVTCDWSTVSLNAHVTALITVTPTAAGLITNTATVGAAEVDPNPTNNTASISTLVQGVSGLSIGKSASPNPVYAGQRLTYTVTITNSGPDNATGVVITDTLPLSVNYASSSASPGSCVQASNVVTCTVGNLANGSIATTTIVVTPTATAVGTIANTATVMADQLDLNPTNNTVTQTTQVLAAADLSIGKSAVPNPATVNQPITYTIVVTNNGPSTANNVVVTDTFPLTFTFGSANADAGVNQPGNCTPGTGQVACTFKSVASGTRLTITVTGTPTVVGAVTNQASTSADEADPRPLDNAVSLTVPVLGLADLAVGKQVAPDPGTVGRPITHTVVVSNAGPSTANNVVLTDTLPLTVTVGPTVATQGGCAPAALGLGGQNVICALGTIASGGRVTVTLVVTPTQPGTIVNSASVSANEADPNRANNTATVSSQATLPVDLVLFKSDSPQPVLVNQPMTYTIDVHNYGQAPATNVVLTDTLPITVVFGAVTSNQGSCQRVGATNVVTCALGTILAAPAVAFARVQIRLTPPVTGTVVDVAQVTSDQVDSDPATNTFRFVTAVGNPPPFFRDVGLNHFGYSHIQLLLSKGITNGCHADVGGVDFCPDRAATRAEIVTFLVRARGETPISGTNQTFADVPPGHPFYGYIERAAADNIARGFVCGGPGEPCDAQNRPYFRPNASVTRGEMAAFLVRAANLTPFQPVVPAFSDVLPGTTSFFGEIERLNQQGITRGCSGDPTTGIRQYCPDRLVTREELAVFIVRTFGPTLFPTAPRRLALPSAVAFLTEPVVDLPSP